MLRSVRRRFVRCAAGCGRLVGRLERSVRIGSGSGRGSLVVFRARPLCGLVWAISTPWSQGQGAASCWGRVMIDAAIAPDGFGGRDRRERQPVFGFGFAVSPGIGRCPSIVNLVARSTKSRSRTVQSRGGQVAFPVVALPGVGLVRGVGRHDLGADELAAPLPGPCRSGDPATSPGSPTRHQLRFHAPLPCTRPPGR